MSEESFLRWLEREAEGLPTPAYVYDESSLAESVAWLKGLLPPNAQIFYSLKANPQPGVVRRLADRGVGAEVASARELEASQIADVPADRVLVGGVCKSAAFLRTAIEASVAAVIVDSPAEWARIETIIASLHAKPKILLRINPGVTLGGLDMGGASQFGMSSEEALTVGRAVTDNPRADFAGLHIYLGSQRLTLDPVLRTIDLVTDAIESFAGQGYAPHIVDVGLGLGVPYLSKDDELPYAEAQVRLHERWQREVWSGVTLWSEAGRALVARSGYFVARVLETKRVHGQWFAMLDGGLNVHNPGVAVGRLFRSNPRFLFPDHPEQPTTEMQIVGNLCTSADCIGRKVLCPELAEGDLVVVPNAGAYCQTTALWGFNSQTPFAEILRTIDDGTEVLQPQHALFASEGLRS